MDMQLSLNEAVQSIRCGNYPHARRIIRIANQVTYDRYMNSMFRWALRDIYADHSQSAINDVKTARRIDEWHNTYAQQMAL